MTKTNAMRFLDKLEIEYEILTYDIADGKIDGESVARKISAPVDIVYKTLVLKGESYFVVIVPVNKEINLKTMAKTVGTKKVQMIAVKDLLPLTGYVRGGCSPFAMKKNYPCYIQDDILKQEVIIVSAGQKGLQVKLKVQDFLKASNAKLVNITN